MTVAEIVEVNLRDLAKKWGVRHCCCSRRSLHESRAPGNLLAGNLLLGSILLQKRSFSSAGKDLSKASSMSRVWMICSL